MTILDMSAIYARADQADPRQEHARKGFQVADCELIQNVLKEVLWEVR